MSNARLRAWAVTLVAASLIGAIGAPTTHAKENTKMDLGNFSVSLAVKDIHASMAFYEKLGFVPVGGKLEQNWIVLQSGNARVGLFQGMFPRNTMTFNPGWGKDRAELTEFADVRELQSAFKAAGLVPSPAADESTRGPAYFMLTDPDGNPLLFDQHVPSPPTR